MPPPADRVQLPFHSEQILFTHLPLLPCQGLVFRVHPRFLFWGARGEGAHKARPSPSLPDAHLESCPNGLLVQTMQLGHERLEFRLLVVEGRLRLRRIIPPPPA